MDTESLDRRERTAFIYLLIDPFTGAIRYVGKSIRPVQRLTNHCNESPTCHRTKWIKSVRSRGAKPVMMIVDRADENWQEIERWWISYGREQGWPLTNATSGGDGVPNLSGESKERLLATWKGRKHRPESLAKIGRASRGRKHTEEYKEYMRRIMSVREFTDQHRMRISLASRRFTPDDIVAIRRRIASGEKIKDIAASFGVHRMTISRIRAGHIYQNIQEESRTCS